MAQTTLPPGFRFHPTDVELVAYYLKRKIMGKKLSVEAISECELYKYAPWDLPGKSLLRSRDLEWYFFCPRGKKYPNGSRANRGTPNGYWKTSGKDRTIMLNSRIVGMKKTLIFHEGKAPKGERTDWVMYEYRMDNDMEVAGFSKDSYMLCKIFKKSGLGPKIGEQYGAPFNEEEWEEDVDTETSMFPLMSWPSSELVDAVEELPVLHTVTAEQSPCEQATPVAASEPPSQLGGTEVVSADHTPNAVDACSCPAFDGFLLEELAMFLNNSPYRDSSNGELADFPDIPEAEAQALQINSDDIYNELEELLESGDVSTVNYPSASYMSTAKHIQPIFSQFGSSGHFLELNDLIHLGETSTSELCAPKNILPQYPLEQGPCNQLNHGNCDNGLAASFAAGNSLPTFPCTMHVTCPHVGDNNTFTSDHMDTDNSNPTSTTHSHD